MEQVERADARYLQHGFVMTGKPANNGVVRYLAPAAGAGRHTPVVVLRN
jgi:hypothetical protein